MSRSPALAVALSCGLALALGVVRPAHAAPARHSGSVAACAARQTASVTLGDDVPVLPYSASDIANARWVHMEDLAVEHERRNAEYLAHFNPHATRDYLAWVRVQQRCYGHDMGLDRPMPATVEVTIESTVTIQR